jgi:RNA polymerase sigma-70 factor, ECF subfamily
MSFRHRSGRFWRATLDRLNRRLISGLPAPLGFHTKGHQTTRRDWPYNSNIPTPSANVTDLLLAWRQGDDVALERLTSIVYAELHRIAHRCLAGERVGHTLETTALVNEAYLHLVGVQHVNWRNRAHFLAVAATLTRRILVDAARARRSQKRGGGALRVTFDEQLAVETRPVHDVLAVNDALDALAAVDQRKSQVV